MLYFTKGGVTATGARTQERTRRHQFSTTNRFHIPIITSKYKAEGHSELVYAQVHTYAVQHAYPIRNKGIFRVLQSITQHQSYRISLEPDFGARCVLETIQ